MSRTSRTTFRIAIVRDANRKRYSDLAVISGPVGNTLIDEVRAGSANLAILLVVVEVGPSRDRTVMPVLNVHDSIAAHSRKV